MHLFFIYSLSHLTATYSISFNRYLFSPYISPHYLKSIQFPGQLTGEQDTEEQTWEGSVKILRVFQKKLPQLVPKDPLF